jgi:bifunctional non-homologous end joining protein LigD
MRLKGKKFNHYIKPMLATAVDKPFDSNEWLFELKLDGYRAIAELNKQKTLLYSRNGLDLSLAYPAITKALQKITIKAVIDGEIVVLDENGKPSFQELQNYTQDSNLPVVYYVFDILSFDEHKLYDIPLIERKKMLKKVIGKGKIVRYCDHILHEGKSFFNQIKKDELEGIVAKKKDSFYSPGVRTKEWLKIKYNHSQEAIIVGYTEPKGSRQHFGSLLLAEYKGKNLKYIGHTGTGFNGKSLKDLMVKMKKLITHKSSLSPAPKANGPVTWIKPELVCEVKFTEVTKEGSLRHPVYKGLRIDKSSKAVKAESEKELPTRKLINSTK